MATRSCEAIVEKLNIARTTSDQGEKQEIIEEVRKKVCNKKERKVCCENSNAPLEKNSVNNDEGENRLKITQIRILIN